MPRHIITRTYHYDLAHEGGFAASAGSARRQGLLDTIAELIDSGESEGDLYWVDGGWDDNQRPDAETLSHYSWTGYQIIPANGGE